MLWRPCNSRANAAASAATSALASDFSGLPSMRPPICSIMVFAAAGDAATGCPSTPVAVTAA